MAGPAEKLCFFITNRIASPFYLDEAGAKVNIRFSSRRRREN
jgi:hypothetical protein